MNRAAGLLATWMWLAPAAAWTEAGAPPAAPRVLRYALRTAETGFDPAQVTDVYSRALISNIFDPPLEYSFLAHPAQLRPNTLMVMPEVSADFRTFTLRVRPGIHFADDPAFHGHARELTAADYVYSLKRHYDPRWKSGSLGLLEACRILGLTELRQAALTGSQPFDYDREAEGLRAIDRYTLRIRLAEPNPRFVHLLADPLAGAVAREVVEAQGDKVMEHPVGTGPFRLAQWRRSSRMVFERNPGYRERRYDEAPAPGQPRLLAEAAHLKGRRLPLVDRVEVSVIEESQPRWLAFLNGEHDVLESLPAAYADQAIPRNRLAPHLAQRGIVMERFARVDLIYTYFAMEHPLVGGYEPRKVALRRAIGLAFDVSSQIRLLRRGQAIPAQSVVPPEVWGFDPGFKSEAADFDRARARALLDLYGYVDRDGDGWRDQPDGSPLELEYATQPEQDYRQLAEHWQKSMTAIGLRVRFKIAAWPENLKAARAGKLMLWNVAWIAGTPDAEELLALAYGPNKGQTNYSRFDLPAYNRLFEQQHRLPDGPERLALVRQAQRLLIAYAPFKVESHRIFTDLAQPWVIGYHRNIYVREFWRYVDIDPLRQPRR